MSNSKRDIKELMSEFNKVNHRYWAASRFDVSKLDLVSELTRIGESLLSIVFDEEILIELSENTADGLKLKIMINMKLCELWRQKLQTGTIEDALRILSDSPSDSELHALALLRIDEIGKDYADQASLEELMNLLHVTFIGSELWIVTRDRIKLLTEHAITA